MRQDEVLERIGAMRMFSACSKKELGLISRLATEVEVAPGTVLTREGAVGQEFAIIMSGEARVSRDGAELAVLGPNDHYGEMALIDDGPRTATITAHTPMSLMVVGRGQFAQLMDDVPSVARAVVRGLAARIRELEASGRG
jgi:CRP-like cAMP-binding protein